MNIELIDNYLKNFGFEVDDIQADEPNVGISTGWVLFKPKNSKWLELSFCDAEYLVIQKKDKEQFINSAVLCKELN